MPHHTESSSRLTKNGHQLGISSKISDVLPHPLQRHLLILKPMVSSAARLMLILESIQRHKSQGAKAVVQGYDDDVMSWAIHGFIIAEKKGGRPKTLQKLLSLLPGGRCFLPQAPRSYPIPMAHRVTPVQPEVTPGTKSYWHTGTTPSLVWQTKY